MLSTVIFDIFLLVSTVAEAMWGNIVRLFKWRIGWSILIGSGSVTSSAAYQSFFDNDWYKSSKFTIGPLAVLIRVEFSYTIILFLISNYLFLVLEGNV